MKPIRITARDNPAIRLYGKISRSKKNRMKEGLFVLEGLRLVLDAVYNGVELTHLFWTEEGYMRWNTEAMQTDLKNTRCMIVSDPIGADLAQTEHTQGVYAICRIPRHPQLCELVHSSGIYAILYRLQDPGNVGMILRTADALGLDGVICAGCCDIYSPKVVRATMGSLFRISVCCTPDIEEIITVCRNAGVETCASVVSGEAERVGNCRFSAGTAVLIGNEGNGLPSAVSDQCSRRVTIPMHGTVESLNAAMAAGIILWEAKKNTQIRE